MKTITINDRYSHINFYPLRSVGELSTGMMVQVCESNNIPLSWEWTEVTQKFLSRLYKITEDKFKWIRLPKY